MLTIPGVVIVLVASLVIQRGEIFTGRSVGPARLLAQASLPEITVRVVRS